MATMNSIGSEKPVQVSFGGTAVNAITDHSLIVGSGAAAVTELGVATHGQIPIGSTGADPVLATLTEGANITITNAAGSITIAGAAVGVLPWTEVVGTTQALAVNNGYILNNAALVTATLPAAAAVGNVIEIVGEGAGGWLIVQNAGQTIHFLDTDTTAGAGGSLASTHRYNTLTLICITADTDFLVKGSVGNITVV